MSLSKNEPIKLDPETLRAWIRASRKKARYWKAEIKAARAVDDAKCRKSAMLKGKLYDARRRYKEATKEERVLDDRLCDEFDKKYDEIYP